nr:DNA translocase FtsK [Entomospira nematocera]
MLFSAKLRWPTATIIGRFFFAAFGMLSLYLPLYLASLGLYLQKSHRNNFLLTAINLSFLPFITITLLIRFLYGVSMTDWELFLFSIISQNNRSHFLMVLIVLLLLEMTIISYFWYLSRQKNTKKEEEKSIDENIEINITINENNNDNTNQVQPNINILKRQTPSEKQHTILTLISKKINTIFFGKEQSEDHWQDEVKEILEELKNTPTSTENKDAAAIKTEVDLSNTMDTASSATNTPKEAFTDILEDPILDSWHENIHTNNYAINENINNLEFPHNLMDYPDERDHLGISSEDSYKEEILPDETLSKEIVSSLINDHLGIEPEVEEDPISVLSDSPQKNTEIPIKLQSPSLDIEREFNEKVEHWDEDFLPPHMRGSFFTQEEQEALHAIGEEIVENAQLEMQIADLIEEANRTLDKIIVNTHLNPEHQEALQDYYNNVIKSTLLEKGMSDSALSIDDAHLLNHKAESDIETTMTASDIQPHTTKEISEEIPSQPEVEIVSREPINTVSINEDQPEELAPFVSLPEAQLDDADQYDAVFQAEEHIPLPPLPGIKEELHTLPFIQQSIIEKSIEDAVLSPTTTATSKSYSLPSATLLHGYDQTPYWEIDEETENLASILENTLKEFKIEGSVTSISKGPAITMFELLPASGVKLSRIESLADNIAFRLAAKSVRIVAPIPGKQAVGVEIPNKTRAIVSFRELIDDTQMHDPHESIPVVLGKDISGDNQVIDLAKTPHLLIAGATGSGKSVCVNGLITSILFTKKPSEVRLMLIDPKIVELKPFNDVPHLLTPVITDPKRALQAIQWVNDEMDRRYALLDNMGSRNIASYNHKIKEMSLINPPLPYLVVVIDEFADLMATGAKELEGLIARLAAKSRAAGIHLVLATQRPSVDVITGLIKANFPSRIAFMVAGKMDSRVILDTNGAEQLLGKGDMLFISSWSPIPMRIQGAFLSDEEVEQIAEFVKSQGSPNYIDDEIFYDDDESFDNDLDAESDDVLFNQAVEIVTSTGKASASYLQRRFKIGYNRAARLIEMMEDRGIVGPANGSKPREVLRNNF